MDLRKIVEAYSTPIYVYDQKIIEDNYRKLKYAIGENATLFYSMKANPLSGICKIMYDLGAGIEVASIGELDIALSAGIPSDSIIFTSPGKTYEELEYSISKKIKHINVESYNEINQINEIAAQKNMCVNVSVRINPEKNTNNAKIKMSGVSSQFGVEESNLDKFLEKSKKLENVNIYGFQIYMGTQMLNPVDIEMNTDYAINLFLIAAKKWDIDLKTINVGGGFGVKYFENESELDIHDLKIRLSNVYRKYKDSLLNTQIIFESGRYLMADAGIFVTKVLNIKESKGNIFAICDGGSNCHSSAAFLGRFVRNNFPITSYPDSDEKTMINVTGPLCTPLDIIGQKVMINKDIKIGDYIIIRKSGAYGITYSYFGFLSHDIPAEIIIDNETIKVLRKRVKARDYIDRLEMH